MLIIGGEDKSVGQYILNMADDIVGIRQSGRINSLNASVSAGIAMYALGR
jgi:tRNA G18 (ribose-2'-O)-methylase SpoU